MAIYQSMDQVEEEAWKDTLATVKPDSHNLIEWREEYVSAINTQIEMDSQAVAKGLKLVKSRVQRLNESAVARVIEHLYTVKVIDMTNGVAGAKHADASRFAVGIYDEDDGVYYINETAFEHIIGILNTRADRHFVARVIEKLRERLKDSITQQEHDPDLIPFKNGVLNYKTKKLQPHNPEHVFLWRVNADWDENAPEPHLTCDDGTDWTFDNWLLEIMSGVEEDRDLIYEIIGSIVRPEVDWQTAVWFYSSQGASGKGTLLTLMREALGSASVDISLAEMGEDFKLEELYETQARAIFADENDVGVYIDKMAAYKALADGSRVQINRKGRRVVSICWKGRIVECVNEKPKFADRSQSAMRRNRCVEFYKHYDETTKKREIKDRFLKDQRVIQWVLKHALKDLPDYYTIRETANTRNLAGEIMESNNPVAQFVTEMLHNAPAQDGEPELHTGPGVDHIPYEILYSVYLDWKEVRIPDGKKQSLDTFKDLLKIALEQDNEWESRPRGTIKVTTKYTEDIYNNPWLALDEIGARNQRYATSKDPAKRLMLNFAKSRYDGGIWRKK